MKGESTADDLQAQGFHFLKKRKKRKQREYNQECEDGERERAENTELNPASPLLFEAAQRGESCKKKKKHKRQRQEQEQHSLVDNSCLGGENDSGEVTGGAASQKKKKKKKLKHSESPGEERDRSGDPEKQQSSDSCPESTAAHPEAKQTIKKKRKHKLSGKDEEDELPASDTGDKNECKRPKKVKKKRNHKLSGKDEEGELPASDTGDRNECKRPKKKKKRGSRSPAVQEEPLSPPEQHRQEADTPLPSPAREGAVSLLQPLDEDAASDSSPGWREDPRDLSAHFSKGTKAAQRKAPGCARKKKKSRAFVIEESSSESEIIIRTPGPWASRKKDRNNSFTEVAASDELDLDNEETLNSTVSSAVDLDTAKQELEEFIPHVRNISDSSIRKMAGRDLTRFKQFKRQGIAVKFGRFSEKENNQIRKNVEEFLVVTGIDSAEKLLFTSRYPEDKGTISRLKAEHLFCEKISEGIPRPWRLIYYRARKMFDPNNYKGRYSREEKEKLKKYHALYGNDWKKIAGMMSRSNLSVAMKYSEIKSAINYGPWSKEEIQKLMHAMEEVIRKRLEDTNSLTSSGKSSRDLLIDREKLFQKFPWTEIEAKVGTRYWRQCKQKWNTILTNKMTKGQQLYRGTKALQAKINLIKRLHEMRVEDANEVNWEELSNTIGDVPREYVQAKFYKLKVTCVPFWQEKTFSEIIDYLFEKKLPEFEEDLKRRKQKKLSSDSSTAKQQKKAFHLSDIFDSSEESD